MTSYSPAADRLRRQRLIFARAVADKVSMAEAKRRIDAEARADEAERAALRTRAIAEVGRWRDPEPAPAFIPVDDSDDGLAWWQR